MAYDEPLALCSLDISWFRRHLCFFRLIFYVFASGGVLGLGVWVGMI